MSVFPSSNSGRAGFSLAFAIALLASAAPEAEALFSGNGSVAAEATIFEDQPGENGGGDSDVCIGNLATTGETRRAFVRFSLPPGLTPGATVSRVRLTFTQDAVRHLGGGPVSATLRLQRVTGAWTEGGGSGAGTGPCSGGTDEAGVDWNSAPTLSSTTSGEEVLPATAPAVVTFDTNVGSDDDQLISDVQGWVNGSANRGWRLQVTAEGTADNARALTPATLTVEWVTLNGTTCTEDDDCASNSCVHPDGGNCAGRAGCVCCDASTCGGACESCFVGVAGIGTCSPRLAGSFVCSSASCTAGAETLASSCDGVSSACPPGVMNICTPYVCQGSACGTSCVDEMDCVATASCTESNVCEEVVPVPSMHPIALYAVVLCLLAGAGLLALGKRP